MIFAYLLERRHFYNISISCVIWVESKRSEIANGLTLDLHPVADKSMNMRLGSWYLFFIYVQEFEGVWDSKSIWSGSSCLQVSCGKGTRSLRREGPKVNGATSYGRISIWALLGLGFIRLSRHGPLIISKGPDLQALRSTMH